MNISAHLHEKLRSHLKAFRLPDLDLEVKKLLLEGAEAKAQKVLDEAEAKAIKAASAHIKTISLKKIFKVLEDVSKQATAPKPEVTSGESEGVPALSTGVSPAPGGAPAPKTESGQPLVTNSRRA